MARSIPSATTMGRAQHLVLRILPMRRIQPLLVLWVVALCNTPVDAQLKKKTDSPVSADAKDAFGDSLPKGAIARIGTLRYRLMPYFQNAELSPDGKWLVAGTTVWELPAWTKCCVLRGELTSKDRQPHLGPAAFTPDSKQIVVGDSNNCRMLFFDAASGKLVQRIDLPDYVRFRDIRPWVNPDRKKLIFLLGGQVPDTRIHQFVEVWDLTQKTRLRSIAIDPEPVDENRRYVPWSYVISPDGKWLARSTSHPDGGSRGLHLEFFDLDTGKPIHKMPIDFRINALVFSANGKWLATSDDQGKADRTRITVYEVPSGKQLQQWGMQGPSFGRLLGFSPDGPSLYIGESKGTVTVWDAARGRQTAVFKAALPCTVHRLAFTSKGKVHALGMDWTAVRYWDVESGKSLWPTRVPVSTICNLAFSPTGDLFVATEDGDMGWWNPRTAVKLRDVKLESTAADATYPLRITLGTDVVAINAAKFFDAGTGKLLFKSGYVGYPRDVHFFDGGKKAAALQSGKLRAWDSRSGRELWSVDLPLGHGEWENKLAVTSTGNYFAVGLADHTAGRVLLWDSTQKKFVREWAARSMVDAVSFSADARWLAFADRDRVRLIRVGAGTGERQFTAAKNDPWSREEFWINQMAFSPDGRQLAQAAFPLRGPLRDTDVTNLRVFEVASGKLRLVLAGHPFFWPGSFAFGGPLGGSIRTLAYSPDSTLLVSGATDATALVWNAGLRAFAATPDAKDAADADLAHRFEGMAGSDAKAAFQNMIALVKTPKQTVKLLAAKIVPAKTPDSGDKTVARWIEDIGSNQFAIRSKASAMLQKIGPSVEAELRAALPKAKDVESKRRIEAVLGHFAARAWTQEDVSHARVVEILEAIGTPDAHALLARWSAGDAGAVLTQEAAKTLKRVR